MTIKTCREWTRKYADESQFSGTSKTAITDFDRWENELKCDNMIKKGLSTRFDNDLCVISVPIIL